jgi:hypothetical protein
MRISLQAFASLRGAALLGLWLMAIFDGSNQASTKALYHYQLGLMGPSQAVIKTSIHELHGAGHCQPSMSPDQD